MCYHTSINADTPQLEARYGAKLESSDWKPTVHANAFSSVRLPIVRSAEPEKITLLHWGLIPHWTKDNQSAQKLRTMTANCRFETMYDKPSFRGAAGAGRRGLIPVTGFFEWHSQGKKKFPFYIHPQKEGILSIAGLWDEWADPATGEVMTTYTMLTGPANPLMARIHNSKERMPCLLTRKLEKDWLEPRLGGSDVLHLLAKPYPGEMLAAHSVSRDINSRSELDDSLDVLRPYEYAELGESGI